MDVNLVLFKKDGSQQSFSLPSNITMLGRRHDCDLCIPLREVSRRHCQLSQNNESMKIRDLDSRLGTFLNGKRIDEAPVNAGDYIKIGSLTFQIQIDGKPEKPVPPAPPQPKPAKSAPKPTQPKTPAEAPSGSFPDMDMEADKSDSFLIELEDL
jgi:pSer/pThr/pTyr-binding forkhead associated (FHA) protein